MTIVIFDPDCLDSKLTIDLDFDRFYCIGFDLSIAGDKVDLDLGDYTCLIDQVIDLAKVFEKETVSVAGNLKKFQKCEFGKDMEDFKNGSES